MPKNQGCFKIFFAHQTIDSSRASQLKETLRNQLPNFEIVDSAREVPTCNEWKEHATPIISDSDGMVCLIGDSTHASEPIDWEIREAHRLGKPLLIATLNEGNRLPAACSELRLDSTPWEPRLVAGRVGEMLLARALFQHHQWTPSGPPAEALMNQYTLMVNSWESLITRRQTVNTLYLSANSALLAGVGVLLSSTREIGPLWAAVGVMIVGFLGGVLSFNWRRTILSYGILSRAKSKVVSALEDFLPAKLFDAEWRVLEARRYTSTTDMEMQTAMFFLALFLVLLFSGTTAFVLIFAGAA